jgi:Immunity protein 52
MSDLYIAGYWGPRDDAVESCASRLVTFLSNIGKCDPLLRHWRQKAQARAAASKLTLDCGSISEVVALLRAGRARNDFDGSQIRDLGFRVGLWNGEVNGRSAGLTVTCGLSSSNANLRNSVVVNVPDDYDAKTSTSIFISILQNIITSWDPDWGGVISRSSRECRKYSPQFPFVDWMVYIRDNVINMPALPASAEIVEIVGYSPIIVVQPTPISTLGEEAISNVNAVEKALCLRN